MPKSPVATHGRQSSIEKLVGKGYQAAGFLLIRVTTSVLTVMEIVFDGSVVVLRVCRRRLLSRILCRWCPEGPNFLWTSSWAIQQVSHEYSLAEQD